MISLKDNDLCILEMHSYNYDENKEKDSGCEPYCDPNCDPTCNPVCSPSCYPCYPGNHCNPETFYCSPDRD